jgi:hypothetical protein
VTAGAPVFNECTLSGQLPRRRDLRPPRLSLAHRYAAVRVDLHHEAPGVVARGPAQAFPAAEDDRVGVGPRLDREAFGVLLVKEGVESVLPCAGRVDLAHLAVQYGAWRLRDPE